MQCVLISDDTYRLAAKLVGVKEVHLAPVDRHVFNEARLDVDAFLMRTLALEKLEEAALENSAEKAEVVAA